MGNAAGGKLRLVVEDASKVVAIGEDVSLHREEGTTAINQVDAGEPILLGDLLGTEMLLHREWVVGAALDRSIIRDNHHLTPTNTADTSNNPCSGNIIAVDVVGRQRTELEKGSSLIKQ